MDTVKALEFFRRGYCALTDHRAPFPWQEGLFLRFCAADIPRAVDLPTGAGKTSVMVVWLLALGYQARTSPNSISLPRRLVWVVDRRVVVDQATAEADRLANRLAFSADQEPVLWEVRSLLARLCQSAADERSPLAVSTLRGEREDNREWSENPTRAAIVVGTVDMIGSRLLFSGYGDNRRRRALHAGLLGQDALVVNDEAHLTPAFAALVNRVASQAGGARAMRALLLSATQRDQGGGSFPENLDADLSNEESEFAKRYRAIKRLHLLPPTENLKDEIRELGLKPDRRTIVFVRSPKDARDVAAGIKKKHGGAHVPLITGMQRGYERDKLLGDEVVRRFLSKDASPAGAPPCWLVATSAGEVGVDLSADRLITDLETADHLLQRFGRLNRFGETEGDAYVVYSPKQIDGDRGDAERLRATRDYLQTLGGSASPEVLRRQPPPTEAISRAPNLAALLPWHLDVWSMTSINAAEWPSRPAVGPWLRGDEEGSPPETYVAWRDEVEELAGVPTSDLEEILDCHPVLAHERLKQYTRELCDTLKKSSYIGKLAMLVAADGEVCAGRLEDLLQKPEERFRYATLIMPPGVGLLDEHGMVDWSRATDKLSAEELARYDVSCVDGKRQKFRVAPDAPQPDPGLRLRCTVEIPSEDENEEGPQWMYFSGSKPQRARPAPQLLADHQAAVAAVAADLARRLGFDERLVRVFHWAGEWHDRGKDRAVWQRAAGNRGGGPALAKSSCVNARVLGGYRHEVGSLLDAEEQLPPDFAPEERDLALHLIAAHHGWARPHFPSQTFDKTACRRSERAALECARRFGRLQRLRGAWSLAYLEAIFHSADAIASEGAPELPLHA